MRPHHSTKLQKQEQNTDHLKLKKIIAPIKSILTRGVDAENDLDTQQLD
jgi:hypothetical protein